MNWVEERTVDLLGSCAVVPFLATWRQPQSNSVGAQSPGSAVILSREVHKCMLSLPLIILLFRFKMRNQALLVNQ